MIQNKMYPWYLAQIRNAWVTNVTLPLAINAAMIQLFISWIDETQNGTMGRK